MGTIVLKEKFDGHIILYCKGHYGALLDVSFFEGLRRIWAVRCGIEVQYINKRFDEYIANHMLDIIKLVQPKRMDWIYETLHKHLVNPAPWVDKDLTPIELVIRHYGDILSNLQINERLDDGSLINLVSLPKPQKGLFNRIINGKAKKDDYSLVK